MELFADFEDKYLSMNTSQQRVLLHEHVSLPLLRMRPVVVYNIPCKDCGFSHIGETSVHLHTRVNQHKDAVQKGELQYSAVAQHVYGMSNISLTGTTWLSSTIIETPCLGRLVKHWTLE